MRLPRRTTESTVDSGGRRRGLSLNRSKSILFISQDADASNLSLPAQIPISRSGFCLLGSAIGPAAFCESIVMSRVEKIRTAVTKLRDLEDSQMETTLLCFCLSLPKFNFILRSCLPSHIRHAASVFDGLMRESLSDLVGAPLSDWAWLKASLPSSLGGLNMRSATLHAPSTYVSSLDQSWLLMTEILDRHPAPSRHLAEAVPDLAQAAESPDWVTLEDIDVPDRQCHLSRKIDEASYNSLLASAPDTRSRALALSSAIPHAGDWLEVVPSSALGHHLHDCEFRLCLCYWLGLRLQSRKSGCPFCTRGLVADSFGDHQVGCGGNGDRIHRRDALRDVLYAAAQSAALAPRKEIPSLIPGSCSRPADVFLPIWCRGRPAALDVSVISTLQPHTLYGAANNQGHALKVAKDRKMAAHNDACSSVGVTFIPLVVESLGGWS